MIDQSQEEADANPVELAANAEEEINEKQPK